MRFGGYLVFGFLVIFFLGFWGGNASCAAEKIRIALLPLVDRNGEEPHWGYLIRDWVRRILEEEPNIEVYDSFTIDNLVRGSRISWDTLLMSAAAQTLGKRAGCHYILTGSFRHREVAGRDRIIVTPRLHRITVGDYVDIPSEMFDGEKMDLVARYVAEKTLEALGIISSLPDPGLPVSSLPFILPLYQGLLKADEAIRTYGEHQYPDRPLWREAFALAEETIRDVPDYLEAYYYLANMYRETGWWAKEAETWDLYLARLNRREKVDFSWIAQVYLRLAHSYFRQRNLDLALTNLRRAIELNPQLVEAYLLLGRIYYESDQVEEAEKAYGKAYELDPNSKEAQYFAQLAGKARIFGKSAYEAYTQGYQYFTQGNLNEAEKHLQEAVRLNPGFREAYYWLGRTLYEVGKLDKAEQVWETVLEMDPFNSQVRRFLDRTQQERRFGRKAVRYFQSGYEFYEKGDYQKAIELFRQATLESPAFLEAHEYLARCYYRLGWTKEYLEEREKVARLLPNAEDKAWHAYSTGYELFSWGEKEQAREWLEKAVTLNDALGEAHLLLGEIYAGEEEWSRALIHYGKARDILEGEAKGQALWGLVTAYFALQRFAELLPILETVIGQYPYADFLEEAEALRVEALVREKEYQRARLAFQQFQIQFPESRFLEKVSFFYALSFYEEQRWSEALTALKRFLDRYPRSDFFPQVTEMLGYVYRNLGMEEEARRTFENLRGDEGTFLVADTWYRGKNWDQAIAAFINYLSSYPQGKFFIEARLKLASAYLEKGMLSEAEESMRGLEEQLLTAFPVDFLRFRVKLRFHREEWQGVIADLLRLEEKIGHLEEEYLLTLAFAYHHLGQNERAKEVLRQAGKDPEEILGSEEAERIKKALDFMEKGDYFAVLSQLTGVESYGEHRNLAHFLLGKAYYFLNRFDEAYEHLQHTLSSPEEHFVAEARFYLLDVAYRRKEWQNVVELYETLSEVHDPEILWRVAVAHYQLGNLAESRRILEDLVEVDDFRERASLLLLEELYALKEYQEFLEKVPEVLTLYPQHPRREELLYLASWAAYLVGDMIQSKNFIVVYRVEFPSGPRMAELLFLLADIEIQGGFHDEAEGILRELIEREDVTPEQKRDAWYRLGTLFLAKQDFSNAAHAFQILVQGGESEYFDRSAYYLGVCWEYLEDLEEAVKAYRLAIDKAKDPLWKSKAEERFRLLTQE